MKYPYWGDSGTSAIFDIEVCVAGQGVGARLETLVFFEVVVEGNVGLCDIRL